MRKPRPPQQAQRWEEATICGGKVMMPFVRDPDDDAWVALTDGPDWNQAHNLARPPEVITNWRAAVARYGAMRFLIADILPTHGAYCMTGKRGSGKTSAALTLAMHVAAGAPLWGKSVKQGRVAYLAGENPPDVSRRIEETSNMLGLAPADDALIISHGVRDPAALMREVESLGMRDGLFDLVIVDTHMSHFIGDDFNDNIQMANMARIYQQLAASMEGCVLVLTHPVKAVAELVPAGGGSFLNLMDGNYTIERDGHEIKLHWSEKLRSPDFEPVLFEAIKVNQWGSPTVVGRPMVPERMAAKAAERVAAETAILGALAAMPGKRDAQGIAEHLEGAMNVRQIGRWLKGMTGLVEADGKQWTITEAGRTRL